MRLREVPMSPLLLVAAALAASPSKKEQIETLEAQARSLNEQLAALTVSLQEELAAKEAARAEVTAAHVAAAKEVSRVRDGLLDIATELQKLEAELARPLKKGEKRDLEPLLRQVRDLQASVAAFDAGSAEKFGQEVDASAVVGKLKAAMAAGDFNQARAAAELLNGPYRDTEAAGSAKRYLAELSTIGLHPVLGDLVPSLHARGASPQPVDGDLWQTRAPGDRADPHHQDREPGDGEGLHCRTQAPFCGRSGGRGVCGPASGHRHSSGGDRRER
jgi:hypothetical protein